MDKRLDSRLRGNDDQTTLTTRENQSANYKIFTLAALLVLGLGWLAVILALTGFFYREIIAGYVILTGLYLSVRIYKFRQNIRLSWEFFSISILSILAIAIFSYFTEPTIFSGRDQGSLSNAAIALAQNHQLKFEFPASREFFNAYGPGNALNFPGFNYTSEGKLITHFPVGYISYLAAFYSLFGLAGFIIANGMAFFIFCVSFYSLSRNYLKISSASLALALVFTSFVFFWFFKFTLSENLALALSWFGIFQFAYFLKHRENKLAIFSCFFSLILLAFARIESAAIVLAAVLILYALKKREKWRFSAILGKKWLVILAIMLAIYFLSLPLNKEFYINLAKGFAGAFSPGEAYPGKNILGGFHYLVRVMFSYYILPYIILAALGIINIFRQKKYSCLIPFLILLPSFIYFINPSISSDHPWMLRRFLFAAMPAAILYAMVYLEIFFRKKIFFYAFLAALFLGNAALLSVYLPIRISGGLLSQTENISRNFGNNDLVLIDRAATGDPWSMMAGPMNLLFKKQAVYFFNPKDLEKIDLQKFEKTYFIIPDENIGLYEKVGLGDSLIPIKDYAIENTSVFTPELSKKEWQNNPVELPVYQKKYVYGKIYLLKN